MRYLFLFFRIRFLQRSTYYLRRALMTCSDAFLLHAVRRTVALEFTIVSTWQWNPNSSTKLQFRLVCQFLPCKLYSYNASKHYWCTVHAPVKGYISDACSFQQFVTAANLEPMNCGIALPLMRFQCSLHLRIHGQLFVAVCAFRHLPSQSSANIYSSHAGVVERHVQYAQSPTHLLLPEQIVTV